MGGGLQVAPGTSIESNNGVPYPTNVRYDECYTQGRPGAMITEPDVALAQVAMAGGYRRRKTHRMKKTQRTRRHRGGAVADFVYSARKSRRMRGGCGCMWNGGQRGGQCPYKMAGGQCPYKAVGGQCGAMKIGGMRSGNRTLRGGNRGFSVDVAQSVGGDGPNVAAINTGMPCDVRAGANNPNTVGPLPADPRTYGVGYSATANMSTLQKGGQLSERIPNFTYSETMMGGSRGGGYGGNGFDPACYKADGSEMPVYPATSVGFHFTPNIEQGAALPPGVIPYNDVVQHTARLGGARKSRKTRKSRKASRKAKKSRKH